MKGTMVIIKHNTDELCAVEFDRPIQLDDLKAGVEGYIEIVPYFNTFGWKGTVMNCIAFCNEYGKIENMQPNKKATVAWDLALKRQGQQLQDEHGALRDHLVGNIVIIFGDKEFMKDFGDGDEDEED